MKTIAKNIPIDRRLAELEAESQNIIEAYLKQVIADAKSPTIKTLLSQLQDVRAEQWQLFEKAGPTLTFEVQAAVAA